jgi:hypothetical protein
MSRLSFAATSVRDTDLDGVYIKLPYKHVDAVYAESYKVVL